jgi:hypothetical protein
MNTDRCHMAELISNRGPLEGGVIRSALDWGFGRIKDVVRADSNQWFVFTAVRWDFTAHGRDAFLKQRRVPD